MKLLEAISNDMLEHLFNLCSTELGIEEMPVYELISNKPYLENGNKKSFGEFDGNKIKVITMNRHPMDVMRTLAHELVHWKQMQNGQHMDGRDGSDTENEANSVAGIILRKFGEKYPDYFLNSLPH